MVHAAATAPGRTRLVSERIDGRLHWVIVEVSDTLTTATERGWMSEHGRVFREAWIAGVTAHYPGEPKPGYISPWEDTPEWERASAAAVYEQVRVSVEVSDGTTSKLNRAQRGRFVATCWIAQIYKHIPDPKPGYVADWDDLPAWQQETDADVFDVIEQQVTAGR